MGENLLYKYVRDNVCSYCVRCDDMYALCYISIDVPYDIGTGDLGFAHHPRAELGGDVRPF